MSTGRDAAQQASRNSANTINAKVVPEMHYP
jgi:hypothetical protein